MKQFKIGDRVKCVDSSEHPIVKERITRDYIYTIEELLPSNVSVKLKGLKGVWFQKRFTLEEKEWD